MRSPQALKLRVTLRDEKNRLFDNFTSLDVSWSSSNYDMASFEHSNTGVEMEYREDFFSQRRVKSTCKYETEAFIPWKITFRYVVKLHRTTFSTVYNILLPNFTILLNFGCSFLLF